VRHARVRLLVAAALVAAALSSASAQSNAVSEDTVHEVATQLRCVVCQNLSVADSPSEMAGQMRAIIRERLAAGESPGEVQRYFVQRYGEWILLSPPRRGFNLLVWLLPLVFVMAGLVVVAILVRQWTRRPRDAAKPVAVDPAMSERIRREVERGS
jgi:cytochrome c-type biogenesis protein CcmH